MTSVVALGSSVAYSGGMDPVRWEGRKVDDRRGFERYMREVVRPRINDEASAFDAELQGLATTGVEIRFVERLLHAATEAEGWEVGEAFAECALGDDADRQVHWPWNMVRDRRTPRASLPGADLVGFLCDGQEVFLLIGEVKTSSDARTPPGVMSGRSGMAWQIEQNATRPDVQRTLLQWLYARCQSEPFGELYRKAVERYLESEGKALALVGVLLRDTQPSELDLKARGEALSHRVADPTRIDLFAWYLPVPNLRLAGAGAGRRAMSSGSWIVESLGAEKAHRATKEAGRRRLQGALGINGTGGLDDDHLRFVANALELRVIVLLDEGDADALRAAAAEAFQIARVLPHDGTPAEAAQSLVRMACLGVLGDRGADVKRLLVANGRTALPFDAGDWGERAWATILDVWLRLLRKQGWEDLDAVQEHVADLRASQRAYEPEFLHNAEQRQDAGPAWELMTTYHLAKAAEILGKYVSQGVVDGHYDIRQQLEAQFDRAVAAARAGRLMEREAFVRLLARTARTLVDNSIWTVTRAVNSRVSRFVESMTSRGRRQPIFEMLPPQRRTLRDNGLLGSGHRSVVVSLPTSSGKTFIAQFRILQALNQFDHERGWVAYLAPTRALVNQLTQRLRRDLADVGIVVEKVSPALEIDGLEADMLVDADAERQFRLLVTTPEKLDMMLRGDWESRIGRPLTLVVVDEAHGLASNPRGLRLELLLATINRECRHAQFLLLTPFIPNAGEIARWLAPDSHQTIELGVDWTPNDRVIAIASPRKGETRGGFAIDLLARHTSRNTIDVPEPLTLEEGRPLGLSWSKVKRSPGMLAAATAQVLKRHGTVIVLVGRPSHSWSVAKAFEVHENRRTRRSEDLQHIQRFLNDEMGTDFPLAPLLAHGVAVHHAGLSDDARAIVEWLTERGELDVLVATTTIAQGVNFPVSGVVFGSHQYPYGQDMPPEDFWNIAGRAGRVDQGDLGIIALAAHDDARFQKLDAYIQTSVGELASTLIDMVLRVRDQGDLLQLESLAWQPEWSSFLQYLAHTYRQIGNHERFAAEVEQVLRGTLGFQALRRSHQGWADQLVRGVYNYAARIQGQPLKLVDATGFSWETVNGTLARLNRANVTADSWSPDLFGPRRHELQRMVGVLLQVPELRKSLGEVTGGPTPDGDTLSRIICDWVQGRPLSDMATDYFAGSSDRDDGTAGQPDPVTAMTKCCQSIFGRLTQTASWGLAALQSLTIRDGFDSLPADQQRMLRNLPARVYYGVNSDEAVALRLLGVPRTAAEPLARRLGVGAAEPLHETRTKIRSAGVDAWTAALGGRGANHHRVWSIIEGDG